MLGTFLEQASFPSVQTSMICCPMIDGFVVTDCLRGRLFLRAVQVVEVRDASTDLAIILCQRTLKIPRVEFYARIEPSVVYSTVMSVQSRPTLGRFMYFRTMNPMYYRPSLLLGVQLKCRCKTQRSTSFSSTVSVLLTYLHV